MVEIMERRQEVEWSPDVELDGLDAEKAAALLLAVAPGRRSQSFDGAAGQENNSARASAAKYTDTTASNCSDRSYGGADTSSPACAPQSMSEFSPRQDDSDCLVERSPPRLLLSPRDEPVNGVAVDNGVMDNDGPTGNLPRSSMRATEEDVMNWLSGSASASERRRHAVTSSSSTNSPSTRANMDLERPLRSNDTGNPGGHVSSRSLVTTAEAVAAASAGMPSPRRAGSAGDLISGPSSMLLSLAEFATQELLTMDVQHPRSGSLTASRTSPAAGSPNLHRSPCANSAAGTIPAAARTHRHHLRDRSVLSRNRSGSFHDDDDDDDDQRRAAYPSGGRGEDGGGGQRRRNRPRSVSMPEGMELHATRAWGGGYSTGIRHGKRIEAIKEELDGHDSAPGTRSRTWRSGAGGGFAGSSGRNRAAATGDALFGSIEDAKALIGLGRHRGRWNSVADEEESGCGSGSGDSGEAVEEGSPRGVEGEDGICVSLPHMLAKYADMYNKNGRIGIYTRQEREAIIARFKRKRGRRVWKKKIRYNCRKNLADKRLRIKGRFVKMSPEQRNTLKLKQAAMRAAGARGGAAAAGGDVVNRTDSSTSAVSTEMELVASASGDEISSSAGSGSGATGKAFEDDCVEDALVGDEGDDEEDEEDEEEEEEEEEGGEGAEGEDEYPKEPPKRVRRHSIAY